MTDITINDLDREELLQLFQDRFVYFEVPDLLWARWKIACRREDEIRDQASKQYDLVASSLAELSRAQGDYYVVLNSSISQKPDKRLRAAHSVYLVAKEAFEHAQKEQERLSRKADRMAKTADGLYEKYKEMNR